MWKCLLRKNRREMRKTKDRRDRRRPRRERGWGEKKGEEKVGTRRKGGSEDRVLITGDPHMTRSMQAVGEWVKGDTGVHIGAFPGQTMRTVFEKKKYML